MRDQVQAQDLFLGLQFGHYRIIEKIGSGGMGVVYRALDEHLDREVAIKVLHPGTIADEAARRRFQNEARALSKLNHPNIATIHDFDTQRGTDFLVMEFLPGETLSHKLAGGPLPEKEIVRLGIQLAEGLAAAHEHGVVHRDLKPGNLLCSEGRLKILDFGLAKLRRQVTGTSVTESMEQTHSVSGTLPYMAPEQLLGEDVDARTDLYAAGLVLYEMATGQRPFADLPSGQLIAAILKRSPIPAKALNPKLSVELDHIITKCVEKDPENRYQSAKEMGVDLRWIEREMRSDHSTEQVPAKGREPLSSAKRWVTIGAIAAVVLIVAVFLGFPSAKRWVAGRWNGAGRIESLAVLPLVNLSGDPNREYLADGMTEELITQLGKAMPLRVISRQSVMQFKDTTLSLGEIGRKLSVDGIVEGSVVQSGERVRVTARLVDVATEKPLWSDEYDRDLRDVLSLQGEVTRAIAQEIRVKLTPQEQANLTRARTVNPEAYEACLKGRFEWYKLSKEGLDNAEHYYQLALEKDPNYALAYAGLADVWLERSDIGLSTPRDVMKKAKAAAEKALELDDTLAEAHVSLANIETGYEWNWPAAEKDFLRAIQLNPSNVDAHFMYADFLISLKRNQEWQKEMQRTLELDPMSSFHRSFYGWHLVYLGRNDEAIALLQKILAAQPELRYAHMGLWGAYFKKGMDKEALEEAEKFFGVLGDQEVVASLKRGSGEVNYRLAMKRAADVLAARSAHTHVPGVRIARLYAHAGENAECLTWLEKAFAARESPMVHLNVAWDWENLRNEPRFLALLREINFPQ
jgi:serine/threonine-protein kinase